MSIEGIHDRPHGSVYSNHALEFNKHNVKQQQYLLDNIENIGSNQLKIQIRSTEITTF